MKENCLCIRNYINSNKNSADYKEIRDAFVREINDPGVLDRSTILSDSSRLKKESQIITDAFESVTNGMENPGVIEAMAEIEEDSPLISWKYVTLAIDAFYRRDFNRMINSLDMVEEISPAKKLRPVLLHLAGIKVLENPDKYQRYFINKVLEERSFFRDAVQQIKNAIEADAEDLFSETLLLAVRELKSEQPVEAERLALWSIRKASSRDFSQTYFLKHYKLIFGNAEALKLFAIAFNDTEPDIAVLFWLQSLSARLKTADISLVEAAAYIGIITLGLEKTDTVDKDFFEAMNSLTMKLKQDLSLHFPFIELDSKEENPFIFLNKLNNAVLGNDEKKPSEKRDIGIKVKLSEIEGKQKQPVQLSLF